MSLILDFEKLHITIKSSVLTVLGLIPFFFVSIYLFQDDLIKIVGSNPFYDINFFFIICLCFCLSITWYAMNLILTFIAFKFGDYISDDETDIDDIFKSSMVYSIGYLAVSIFLNVKFDFGFYNFLIIAYGFLVFRMIHISSVWLYYFKKRKKKINQ